MPLPRLRLLVTVSKQVFNHTLILKRPFFAMREAVFFKIVISLFIQRRVTSINAFLIGIIQREPEAVPHIGILPRALFV